MPFPRSHNLQWHIANQFLTDSQNYPVPPRIKLPEVLVTELQEAYLTNSTSAGQFLLSFSLKLRSQSRLYLHTDLYISIIVPPHSRC